MLSTVSTLMTLLMVYTSCMFSNDLVLAFICTRMEKRVPICSRGGVIAKLGGHPARTTAVCFSLPRQ